MRGRWGGVPGSMALLGVATAFRSGFVLFAWCESTRVKGSSG